MKALGLKRFVLATVATFFAASTFAHDIGQSYVFLSLMDDRIDVRVELNVRDVEKVLDVELPETTESSLQPIADRLRNYVGERLTLSPDGEPATLVPGDVTMMETDFAKFAQVNFSIPDRSGPASSIGAVYEGPFDVIEDHVGFLVIENNWLTSTFNNEAEIALTFRGDRTAGTVDLSSSSVWSGFLGMILLGIEHIWEGIDHVLFLLALLLPSVMIRPDNKWLPAPNLPSALKQVVMVVTVFTVAHTITLSLATLDVVSLSSRIVESIIAISIAIVALNIIVPMFSRSTYAIVLAFGLFHGFGFASVLGEMPIPDSYMVISLLGFNLGVEIGQVVIVCLVVPVLFLMRNSQFYSRIVMPAGAVLLILISMYWFIERAFDVDLPAGALLKQLIGG